MIITVDPSQSEDIAAFAMVKQYRMQALNVTLNGGTGSSAWQAVQGGEGYTQTVVTPVTGIELVYEDPNAIVSYTVENDDTSNYDAASNAGIILSSIEPTTNAWTYTCVFHADSVPVSSVDIDLLVYGNIARGTEQQGSPATAEEITAQVLAGLETRVTALEEEMPTKADVATTYTKAEIDTALAGKADVATTYTKTETDTAVQNALDNYATMVRTANAQTIGGNKTYIDHILALTSVQNVPAVIPRVVGTGWVKLYESTDTNHANAILALLPRRATSNPGFGILAVGGHNNGTVICKWIAKDLVNTNYLNKVMVTVETDVITVWGANISATDNVNMRIMADVYNGSYMLTYAGFKAATDTAIYTMTTDEGGNITGYTDSDSVVHTFIAYEISS